MIVYMVLPNFGAEGYGSPERVYTDRNMAEKFVEIRRQGGFLGREIIAMETLPKIPMTTGGLK